jgi:hypothetical protein
MAAGGAAVNLVQALRADAGPGRPLLLTLAQAQLLTLTTVTVGDTSASGWQVLGDVLAFAEAALLVVTALGLLALAGRPAPRS